MDYRYSADFPYAAEVYYRAKSILRNRKKESCKAGAEKIREWIEDFKEVKFQSDLEEYIYRYADKLLEQGGWELEYFPGRFHVHDNVYRFNHGDAVELLTNWPDSGNLPDGYPEQRLSDIEALDEILSNGTPYNGINGFLNASEAECYAVIAMERVAEAQDLLLEGKERVPRSEWNLSTVLRVSGLITEAMDIICHAEHSESNERSFKYRKEAARQAEVEMRKEIKKSLAQNAARRRLENDPKQVAKSNAYDCWKRWQKNPNEYKSKSAFAKAMMEKYEQLESQRVIERWCKIWEGELSQQST